MTDPDHVYVATVQFGSKSPHHMSVHDSRTGAIEHLVAEYRAPEDSDEWIGTQGNQHRRSRWRAWVKREREHRRVVNYKVQKMEVRK